MWHRRWFSDHPRPNFCWNFRRWISFDLGAGNPSIIYHCNMKFSFETEAQKEQTDSIIRWTRFFRAHKPIMQMLLYPSWGASRFILWDEGFLEVPSRDHCSKVTIFFSSFWVPTGGGWRFLPSQLIKLQTFQNASSCIFFNTKVQILDCESATWWWSVSTQKKSVVRKTDAKTSLEIWV